MWTQKQIKDEIVNIEMTINKLGMQHKKMDMVQRLSAKGVSIRERIIRLQAQKFILFKILKKKQTKKKKK